MEVRLDSVLEVADAFRMGKSGLHETARRIAAILDEMGIPYAVAGALALAAHGRIRLTEDVDLLVDGISAAQTVVVRG